MPRLDRIVSLTFNGFLKVAFQGSRVTSDAGLIRRSDVSLDRIADAMGPEYGPDGGRLVKHARYYGLLTAEEGRLAKTREQGPVTGLGACRMGDETTLAHAEGLGV